MNQVPGHYRAIVVYVFAKWMEIMLLSNNEKYM